MLKHLLLLSPIIFASCIPVSIAPKIEDKKIIKAKRFKRDLPIGNGYVMEDHKNADEFYHFINMKFDRQFVDVENNVPFTINKNTYYLSFYERERTTKTFNILPLAIDAALDDEGIGPIFNEYESRIGKWYLIFIVRDENLKDCLAENYENKQSVIAYLDELRKEYYGTNSYVRAYLKTVDDKY